jgi:glycosyltransferase involved in cell wall biosynthesis
MPVLNETWSLEQTVNILMAENRDFVREIIIPVHPTRTIPESLQTISKLQNEYGSGLICMCNQDLPFIGGAIRKGFEVANGEFCLMMASDLETDPHLAKSLIQAAISGKADIITASRWISGGGFVGYNPLKKRLNYIFQRIFSGLYRTHLTDMTYGYRILKTELVKKIAWKELKHAIFFETLLKPLNLGSTIAEIPAVWTPRQEGESQIQFATFIDYFRLGLCLGIRKLFSPR